MRVRGLKQKIAQKEIDELESHPMRVRGFKRVEVQPIIVNEGRTPCGCVD